MRTTVAIPDDLYEAAEIFVGQRSFSQFVREAIRQYVDRLQKEQLAKALAEGYQAEAEAPSLKREWSSVELDHWGWAGGRAEDAALDHRR